MPEILKGDDYLKSLTLYVLTQNNSYNHGDFLQFFTDYCRSIDVAEKCDNSLLLMDSFFEGIQYVRNVYHRVGASLNKDPSVIFIISPPRQLVHMPFAFILGKKNVIFLNPLRLAVLSGNNMEEEIVFKSDSGESRFIGTAPQLAALAGLEERHHVAIIQTGMLPNFQRFTQPMEASISQYLADDVELIARQLQIKYAIEHNFSEKSIQSIQKTIDQSLAWRKKHGIDK